MRSSLQTKFSAFPFSRCSLISRARGTGQILYKAAVVLHQRPVTAVTREGGAPSSALQVKGQERLCTLFPQFREKLGDMKMKAEALSLKSAGSAVDGQQLMSLKELEAIVQANMKMYTEGTSPGAPEKSEIEKATMTAGELIALYAGHRGIVSVQMYNGWDEDRGQPIFDDLFVFEMIDQCLSHPDIRPIISTAPENKGYTLILFVNKEPFISYAAHLSSFGFQSSIIAGSPYFKLLCGYMLGYEKENVKGYVRATSQQGSLTPALLTEVEAQIKRLSKVTAKLPWKASIHNSRGKKSR